MAVLIKRLFPLGVTVLLSINGRMHVRVLLSHTFLSFKEAFLFQVRQGFEMFLK
jgi:hypothetical protein